MNKKLQTLLKQKQGKTMYGLHHVLDISPQAAAYIVKEKDLTADYIRIQKIAEYLECDIKDILDLK